MLNLALDIAKEEGIKFVKAPYMRSNGQNALTGYLKRAVNFTRKVKEEAKEQHNKNSLESRLKNLYTGDKKAPEGESKTNEVDSKVYAKAKKDV